MNPSTIDELRDAPTPESYEVPADDPELVASLAARLPAIAQAAELGALPRGDFAGFGPVQHFLNAFKRGWDTLDAAVSGGGLFVSIVMTGGGGFLAVELAHYLRAQGEDAPIVLLDINEEPRWQNLPANVSTQVVDLASLEACQSALGPDTHTIYHFASLGFRRCRTQFQAGDAGQCLPHPIPAGGCPSAGHLPPR